jgi:hypothetical protein
MSLRDVRELIGELLHSVTAPRPHTEPPAPRVVLPTLDERRRQRIRLEGGGDRG